MIIIFQSHCCSAPLWHDALELWIRLQNIWLFEDVKKMGAVVFTFRNHAIEQLSNLLLRLCDTLYFLILSVSDDFFSLHVLQDEGGVRHQSADEIHLVTSDHLHSTALEDTAGFYLSWCISVFFWWNRSFAFGKYSTPFFFSSMQAVDWVVTCVFVCI